jgi:hypothetical protein
MTGPDNEAGLPGEATSSCLALEQSHCFWADIHRYIPRDTQMELGTGPMSGTRKDHARGKPEFSMELQFVRVLLSLIWHMGCPSRPSRVPCDKTWEAKSIALS